MWTTIETLCNNVVVPIAGFVLTIILLNDLIQTVLRGNNFKDFDDSIIIKWIIKALCGVILVSNTYYIASALFGFGTNVCSNGLTTLFGTGDYLDTALCKYDNNTEFRHRKRHHANGDAFGLHGCTDLYDPAYRRYI